MPRAKKIALQGEQTRALILEAAVELFGERGYHATSINQIAKRAGVVQSALHHHFGSKEKLLNSALEAHYPSNVERPDMRQVSDGEIDFVDEVLRVTQKNMRDPHLVRFFSVMTGETLTEDHPAHAFFVMRYDSIRNGFANAIATSKGISNPKQIEELLLLVSILFATSDGLQMQWLRNPAVDFLGGISRVGEMIKTQLNLVK